MEESEAEKEEGEAAGDVRKIKLQHRRAVCFPNGRLLFCFFGFCLFVCLFVFDGVHLTTSLPISFFLLLPGGANCGC